MANEGVYIPEVVNAITVAGDWNTLSKSDLIDQVAAKMGLIHGDYSGTPAGEELLRWGRDGLQWLLSEAPEMAAVGQLVWSDWADPTSGLTIPTESMKIVSVEFTYESGLTGQTAAANATYSPSCEAPQVVSELIQNYSSSSVAFAGGKMIWSEIAGKVYIFNIGTTADPKARMLYFHKPTWLIAGATKTPTEDMSTADTMRIPAGWDGLIADYAAVQAKMKDMASQQAEVLWKIYEAQVQAWFANFYDLKRSVGG